MVSQQDCKVLASLLHLVFQISEEELQQATDRLLGGEWWGCSGVQGKIRGSNVAIKKLTEVNCYFLGFCYTLIFATIRMVQLHWLARVTFKSPMHFLQNQGPVQVVYARLSS